MRSQRVAALLVAAATSAAAQPGLPPLNAPTIAHIGAFVAEQAADSGIPGVAIAVLQDGRAPHVRGFGGDGVAPGGRAVSAQGVTRLLAPASPPGRSTLLPTDFQFRYGEGWFVGPFGTAADARWHLGILASFAAWMVLLPDAKRPTSRWSWPWWLSCRACRGCGVPWCGPSDGSSGTAL